MRITKLKLYGRFEQKRKSSVANNTNDLPSDKLRSDNSFLNSTRSILRFCIQYVMY